VERLPVAFSGKVAQLGLQLEEVHPGVPWLLVDQDLATTTQRSRRKPPAITSRPSLLVGTLFLDPLEITFSFLDSSRAQGRLS
jgi:hypothetical protein